MSRDAFTERGLLVLPRLRVQNANAISSPMTWGFPGVTAFAGLMTALSRKLGPDAGASFGGFGVLCHGFDPQVTRHGYTRSFRLTRNPVLQDGSTAAIVEEGRAHLDITLVFAAALTADAIDQVARQALAERVSAVLSQMRVAGGSIVPRIDLPRERQRPYLWLMPAEAEEGRKAMRRLVRRWLPGYALVGRDDLLHQRHAEMRKARPQASLYDAWLDLSRWTHRAVQQPKADSGTGQAQTEVRWIRDERKGWLVPIPVGYGALSPVHAPGDVAGARDMHTPARFVESVYSIGQWISPHRLRCVDDLLWFADYDETTGVYRCINSYADTSATV